MLLYMLQEIKKNMKKYNATFSLEDKMRESKASKVDLTMTVSR